MKKAPVFYHPEQKGIRVVLMTHAGWVTGELHVPAQRSLREFFETASDFLPMTHARLESHVDELPFFALHVDSVLFVLVEADQVQQERRNPNGHDLHFLLEIGKLSGRVGLPEGVRISDFLVQRRKYLSMYDVHLRIRDPWSQNVIDRHQAGAFLAMHAVIGVSEPVEGTKPRSPSIAPPTSSGFHTVVKKP